MMKGKRLLSLLLIGVMCFSMALQCQATTYEDYKEDISDAEKEDKKLEAEKEKAEKEQKELGNKLDALIAEMEELEAKIKAKEEELSEKEDELVKARNEENDQYESMKKRIKYMYENGNVQFIEILFESENIGDFLNKAEYISTISEYDREMLKVFKAITEEIKEQEEVLKEEYADMGIMQNELIDNQNTLENLLETASEEISGLDSAIAANQKKLKKLRAAAAEALRKQQESTDNPGNAGASVIVGNGFFTHPCPGYTRISSEFGWREQPLPGASTNHKGMDFAAPTGTPIYAAAAGTVTTARYSGNAGKMISINHGDGKVTIYMHCNAMYVTPGQKVTKGQHIAAVGSTGNSTGPHLHFQVEINGVPTNPRKYL